MLFVGLWGVLVAGEAWAKDMMAVLEVSGDQSAKERSLVSDEVRRHVKDAVGDSLTLMTRENMEVMLQDMGVDPTCVAEGACEVETARNLNVDYVISGQITTLDSTLILSLKLYETAGGGLLKAARTQSDSTIGLLDELGDSARELVVPITGDAAPVAAPSPVLEPVAPPSAVDLEAMARMFEAAQGAQRSVAPIPGVTGDEPPAVRDFFVEYSAPVTYRDGLVYDANNKVVPVRTTLALAQLEPEAYQHVTRFKSTSTTVGLGALMGALSSVPIALGTVFGITDEFPPPAVGALVGGGAAFVGGITMIVAGASKGQKELEAMTPAVNRVLRGQDAVTPAAETKVAVEVDDIEPEPEPESESEQVEPDPIPTDLSPSATAFRERYEGPLTYWSGAARDVDGHKIPTRELAALAVEDPEGAKWVSRLQRRRATQATMLGITGGAAAVYAFHGPKYANGDKSVGPILTGSGITFLVAGLAGSIASAQIPTARRELVVPTNRVLGFE